MKAHPRWTSAVASLTVAIWAVPTAADPITAVYDIQVVERSSRQDLESTVIVPFQQQFTLAITFDPDQPGGAGVYGRPAFSPVPLAVPSAPAGLALAIFSSTTHIPLSEGGVFARAEGGLGGSGVIDGAFTVYSASVQLSSFLLAASPPLVVSAETFPGHLTLSPNPFNFFYNACLGVGPFPPGADSCTDARAPGTRIVSYRGTATLTQTDGAVVPEPGTFALVASGLALLSRRRTRRSF
jgi:hypothetical protein